MKYLGDLPDNRKPKDQLKDFTSDELNLSGITKPLTKRQAIKNAEKYISRNQFSKSSCVPSSIANALWNTEKEVLADEFLYTLRFNKPQEGCYWHDIADKVIRLGVCKRSVMPEVKTEKEANAVVNTPEQLQDAREHKQKAYIYVSGFDKFTSILNMGNSIAFSIFANSKEWGKEYPEVLDFKLTPQTAPINHAICAIPNTWYQEKGKDYFIITDSAHFGKRFIRHISRDFFDERFKHGLYFEDLLFVEQDKWITLPLFKGYKFTRDLTVGSRGQDVKMLQEILRVNGFFPLSYTTDYFGGITRQAVKDFQKKYEKNILWSIGLTKPTGYFGKSSIKQISKLIS
jgi:hypothetical protein